MVKSIYIPDQGDIIYFNFSPSVGREQKGVRPAIVISRAIFNQSSGLAVVCPITSKQKSYPFEVLVDADQIYGFALIDQARAIDYSAREFRFVSRAPTALIQEIKAKFISIVS
jgi:mRNA interferase MazF